MRRHLIGIAATMAAMVVHCGGAAQVDVGAGSGSIGEGGHGGGAGGGEGGATPDVDAGSDPALACIEPQPEDWARAGQPCAADEDCNTGLECLPGACSAAGVCELHPMPDGAACMTTIGAGACDTHRRCCPL